MKDSVMYQVIPGDTHRYKIVYIYGHSEDNGHRFKTVR